MPCLRVLLIESNVTDQLAVQHQIDQGQLPWDGKFATSLTDAQAEVAAQDYDGIILDTALIDSTISTLLTDLNHRSIPVIALAKVGQEEAVIELIQQGASDYVIKDNDRHYLKLLPITLQRAIDRKQTDLALIQSEERFRATFEQAAVGICHVGLDGRLLRFNQRFCDISGYTAERLQALTFQDITHPDDLSSDVQRFHQLLLGDRTTYTLEKRYIRQDGSSVWVNLTGSVVCNSSGEPSYLIGVVEDISDRKQAEAALHQLNQELETRVHQRTAELQHSNRQLKQALIERQKLVALVENSRDLIGLTTPDGRVTYLNPAGRHLVGLDNTEDITKYAIPDFHFPEDWPELQATMLLALQRGDVWQGEVRLSHLQTQVAIPVMQSTFPIRHPKTGEVIAFAAIIRDISAKQRTEEQLRNLSDRLSLAVTSAKIGIWEWNIASDQVVWDDQMYQLYGVQKTEFTNAYEAWLKAIHPDDRAEAEMISQQARRGERNYHPEFRVIHPDGSIHFIQAYAVIQRDEQGDPLRMIGINLDITDRKQAEFAIQQSQAKLLQAQRIAHIGNWEFDVQTQAITWSEELYRMVGLDPSQPPPAYAAYLQTVHPEDRATLLNCIEAAITDTMPYKLDLRIVLPDGSIRYHECRGEALQNDQGTVIKLVGTALDITDRKQGELELRRNRDLREAIFERSTDALFLVDSNTDLIVDCNSRAVEMFEAEDKRHLVNICGNTLQRYPFTPTELTEIIAEVTSKGFWSREIEYVTCKGRCFWANIAGTKIAVAGQDVRLVRLSDITDRKQIEQLLQQQLKKEQLLVSVLMRIQDSLDLNAILTAIVQEVHQVLQSDRILIYQLNSDYSGEVVAECSGAPWASMLNLAFPAESLPRDRFSRYCQGEYYWLEDREQATLVDCVRQFMVDFQIRAKLVIPIVQQENRLVWGLLIAHQCSGPRQWQEWEIGLLQQLTGQLAIAIQQANLYQQLQAELIERQRTEAILKTTNEQLQLVNIDLARVTRLKDEFLANMSHELRTPLNAILGMAEILQERIFGPITEKQQPAIDTIASSGKHLLALINDILDLAKIESGKLDLERSITSIRSLCQSSLNLVNQLAHKKNIQLNLILFSDIDQIEVDERRIRQILINLLSNAIKFTPINGTVTLEVCQHNIHPSEQDPNRQHYIRFSVIDTGIGIAPNDIPKLFQAFVQIDSNLNRQYDGTGLGLALVKRIAELHGGWVEVESQLDHGSRFTISLPYQLEIEPKLLQPCFSERSLLQECLDPPVTVISNDKNPLILLAEDNQANVETYFPYLTKVGYQLIVAHNGLEAVWLARRHKPDLILMDIQMPKMDGLEAIRQIRALPGLVHVPIIALTALAMSGDREKCLKAGANEYLSKPVQLKYLITVIAQLLAS